MSWKNILWHYKDPFKVSSRKIM